MDLLKTRNVKHHDVKVTVWIFNENVEYAS